MCVARLLFLLLADGCVTAAVCVCVRVYVYVCEDLILQLHTATPLLLLLCLFCSPENGLWFQPAVSRLTQISCTHTHSDTHVVGGGSRLTRTHTHRPVVGGGKEPHTHTLEGTPSAVGSNTAWTYFLIFLTLLLRSPDFQAVFFFDMRHWGVRRRLGARKRAWLYFNRDSSGGRRNRKHGLQKVALKAWNISWCRQRRYRPYSSSRRRRRMLSGVSAGV